MLSFLLDAIHIQYLIMKIAAKQILDAWFSIYCCPTQEHTGFSLPSILKSRILWLILKHSVTVHR